MKIWKIVGLIFEYLLKIIGLIPTLILFGFYSAIYEIIDDVASIRDSRTLSNKEEISRREIDRDHTRQLSLLNFWVDYWKCRLLR